MSFEHNMNSAWMAKDVYCAKCGFPVVVTQGEDEFDYWWYCANKNCTLHKGLQTSDMYQPDWLKRI